jgi:type I restriction enzyme, R subunit
VDEDEDAKRFDLLILRLQLTLLQSGPGFERLREQVTAIAGVLEEKSAIPMVRDQMALIQEIQTDEYWQDITAPILDVARKRLRALLKLIDKSGRKIVYTDFEEEMGGEIPVALPWLRLRRRFRALSRQGARVPP